MLNSYNMPSIGHSTCHILRANDDINSEVTEYFLHFLEKGNGLYGNQSCN
jgi:hypothetical protein